MHLNSLQKIQHQTIHLQTNRLKDHVQTDQQFPGRLIKTQLLSQIAALAAVTLSNFFTTESKTKTAVPSPECGGVPNKLQMEWSNNYLASNPISFLK